MDALPYYEVHGTEGADVMTGTNASDSIDGAGGDDSVSGLGGRDSLYGGDGNDYLNGGLDSDFLRGGAGRDEIVGGDGNDNLSGGSGGDVIWGGAGDDIIHAGDPFEYGGTPDTRADVLVGGIGNDTYEITENTYVLEKADGGTDTIRADFSADLNDYAHVENLVLSGDATVGIGNAGNNVIKAASLIFITYGAPQGFSRFPMPGPFQNELRLEGGAGNDVLIGGDNADTLIGGTGMDQFCYTNGEIADHITDYQAGFDRIMLRQGDFDGMALGRIDASTFFASSGAGAIARTAEHRFIFDRADGSLYYDPDGSGSAAMELLFDIDISSGTFSYNDIQIVQRMAGDSIY